jgi:methionyl-tRNA synthetase
VVAPGEQTKHHQHHDAETTFFAKGRGIMRVDGESHEVKAGDVIYQPPFNAHTIINTSDEEMIFLTVWWEDLRLWAGGRKPPSASARPRRVLVTAAPPTPNGDLHVGHLSGPYLAADIHARYLKLRGVAAHYLSGSDDHQSYVKTNAAVMGLAPQESADRLAAEIKATLDAAEIRLEEFVRPNQSPYHVALSQQLFRQLHQDGHLVEKETLSPYCESCERYLYEAHIRGRCPHCNSPSGGNLCEDCGRPNDCIDLKESVCTKCGTPPARRMFKRLFFPLARWQTQLLAAQRNTAMNASLRSLCEQAVAAGLPDVAVTHIADWGIPVPVAGYENQRIFVWFEMAARYLAYARHLESIDAYWKSDDAAIVQCFGFDNGFYYALFLPAIYMAYDQKLRLPAAYLMNEFYRLDGLKFSTSRRHAIWGRELLAKVPADVMRFYLAMTGPEVEGTSFTLAEFAATCDRELLDTWQPWLAELGRKLLRDYEGRVPATGDWTAEQRFFYARLEQLTATAAEAYEAATFSPQRAARTLCELVREARRFGKAQLMWKRVATRSEERRTALALEVLAVKQLALLAAPIMPVFAARLWHNLGYEAPLTEHRLEPDLSWVTPGVRTELEATYFSSAREALFPNG